MSAVLRVLFLLCSGELLVMLIDGATPVQLTLYTYELSWTDARAYCQTLGQTLAALNETSNKYVQERMNYQTFIDEVTQDFWIGIYDSNPTDQSQSNSGYSFSASCLSVASSWTNWKSGDPQNTADSMCVAMFKDTPEWRTAQCHEQRPFLCQNLPQGASCTYIKTNRARCNYAEQQATSGSQSSGQCRAACDSDQGGPAGTSCWFYTFDPATTICTLSFGTASPLCQNNAKQDSSTTFRKTCVTFNLVTTSLSGARSNTNIVIPTVSCSSPTTTAATTTTTTTTTTPSTTESTTEPTTTSVETTTQAETTTTTTAEETTTTTAAVETTTTVAVGETTTVSPSLSTDGVTSAGTGSGGTGTGNTAGTSNNFSAPLCGCKCTFVASAPVSNVTTEEIKEELTVPKKTLSSTRRKKESAPDERQSSFVMSTFCIALLAIFTSVFVLTDVVKIYKDVRYGVYHKL